MNKKLRGSVFLLLATIIWGSAFVSQSIGVDHIGPFTFQAIRCLIAVIGLLPIIFISDHNKQDGKNFLSRWTDLKLWKAGLFCGVPLFLACNLQQMGLIDTEAGKSGFLTAMYIVIVPIIGLFRKKKLSVLTPVSVLVAVAGLYFLSCTGVAKINTGNLLTLGCALMFAVQITFIDIFAGSVDALRLNTIQALVCALLSSVVMMLTEEPTWGAVAGCAFPLLHAGILSMGIAYALQILGQRDLEPSSASLIMSLESVFAAIFGALLLSERMTGLEYLGCSLVFAAVILSQIPLKQKSE